MLSFLIDSIVGVITAYLALTNGLAVLIDETLFSQTEPSPTSVVVADEGLEQLPSQYEAIPDILISNTRYQQASVIDALPQTMGTSSSIADALVNIYCQYSTETFTRTTTGTGFFINTDGVILTNAHVAQFLLLEDATGIGDSSCTIRTGSPAEPTYTADLLYISPAWVREHASLINVASPKGTGERDYALLYVTGGIDNRPLPARTPFIVSDTDLLTRAAESSRVTIGGYPALSLTPDNLTLPQAITDTTLLELFTFETNNTNFADLISLAGSTIGARGISGGPVLNDQGHAIGLIVTKGDDTIQGAGSLNAITISYIDRTMKAETGLGLLETGSGRLALRSQLFMQLIVPFLTDELEAEL